jgi:hypothetical protein
METLTSRAPGEPERDPWGPYRDLIEGRLASCADYLRRLTSSLAGEIAPDRLYFASKAWELREAANRLVESVRSVQRWLAECGVQFAEETEARTGICGLRAGHEGDHDDDLTPSAVEQAYRKAEQVRELGQQVGDNLAWLPWHRGSGGPPWDEDTAVMVRMALEGASAARRWATHLVEELTALEGGGTVP